MNKVLTNMNQDLSALEKQTARSNIGAEDASNRVTSIDENSTDAQYPSAKCVFNALQNVGGGFKNGGALIDGDFIEVENNTVSSYDNVSRDPVNFYFDVKDGEVLNSVVELTTAVNATINVYVVKNGFYYLLGNVGGNSVTAGNDYNINVVGNSFILEVVTPSPAYPDYYDFQNYGVKKLTHTNTRLWIAEDLAFEKRSICNNIVNSIGDGWRIPTDYDFNDLKSFVSNDIAALRSLTSWVGSPGTDLIGFNGKANGYFTFSPWEARDVGYGLFMHKQESSNQRCFAIYNDDTTSQSSIGNNDSAKLSLRICKDI